jgi:hypothetical protein
VNSNFQYWFWNVLTTALGVWDATPLARGSRGQREGIRYLISREDARGFRAVAAAAAVNNRRMIISRAILDI